MAFTRSLLLSEIVSGMALTIKMFDDFFEKLNIQQIHPEGERFDPEFHQAMTMEEASHVAPGTVTRVMQSGYTLNQRLLRPDRKSTRLNSSH